MKKLFALLSFAAVLFAACQQAEKPVETTPEPLPAQETMTIYASLETPPATEVSVSDAGIPAWQTGDKIALYDGSDFVDFTISNVSTGAFTGPAGTYTGLAVYPASAAVSVDGSGNLTLNLPTSYDWVEGQTNAPMIAIEDSGNWRFYPVCGMFKYTFSDIPSDATAFHFTVPSKINGNFEIGVPTPGTSVISQVAASSDSEKSVAVNLPSPHPSTMSFYIPVPVSPIAGYDGFAVSITADDGVPAAEVNSSNNITVARSQMRRYKSKSCNDALPAKVYLIGGCFDPSWTWSDATALTKGAGAVYTGTINVVNSQGFKMYLNDDWNATWLSVDEVNSTASNLIVVGGEAYKASQGVGDTQVYPSAFGYESNVYDVTLDLSAKTLVLERSRLWLVGTPFSPSWTFTESLTLTRTAPGTYSASNIAMDLSGDGYGFRIYAIKDNWNNCYTYKGGNKDATGMELEFHDAGGDPPQIFPKEDCGFASGTYDLSFNTSTKWLTFTAK